MKHNLNEQIVSRLPIPEKGERRAQYLDGKVPGFGVRVSSRGAKVFFITFRLKGMQKRMLLGEYPDVPLAKARGEAHRVVSLVKQGIDPAKRQVLGSVVGEADIDVFSEVSNAEELMAQPGQMTFGEAVDKYEKRYCKAKNKASWAKEKVRVLRRSFPDFQDRPLQGIRRRDIIDVLDELVEADKPSAANHAHAVVLKFFKWCVAREEISADPAAGIPKPAQEKARERVLSDAEMVAVLKSAREVGYPFGTIVELLLLTAKRRSEVVGMRWSELDLQKNRWKIPGERTKNGRANVVPLTPRIRALLRSAPPSESDFVFPARGCTDRPVRGCDNWKFALEEKCGVTGWTLHDLRRTAATSFGALGVPQFIIDRCLNHLVGAMSKQARIYNLFEYEDEIRDAYRRWHAYVKRTSKVAAR